MKIIFYITTLLLFTLFGFIIYLSFRKMKQIRKVKGFENCYNFYDVKGTVKLSENPEELNVFKALKAYRNRILGIWFLSLFIALVIFLIVYP